MDNLRAAAEYLVSSPEMNEARRVQFTEIVATESRHLSAMINDALSEYAGASTVQILRISTFCNGELQCSIDGMRNFL